MTHICRRKHPVNKASGLFIRNIYSRHQDRISVIAVFNRISQAAGKRSGLHDAVYESLLITGLREYIDSLNEKDAETLTLYAEYRDIHTDDEHYFQAREAENKYREALSCDRI
ncbi:dpoa decarboxylase [Citrobacter amalonaticus]|uniref:dpoa decarboxylase n=1 Tax=Citrobacter amalonaticus TaxID=35703 RepID=UPI001A26107E|nr:dpoa decarboxylase [Citrobacter amalonaticus]HDQ2811402.1 dpoa decarboxylase [Citrobacter amalonaticus]